MQTFHVELTFTEPLLGTVPKNKTIYSDYIANRQADLDVADEEIETVPIDPEKGVTGFHEDEDGPFLYDYILKGFFKDAASMLRRVGGTHSSKLRAYKKVIDGLVFIQPRRIHLQLAGPMETLERPLRAQTAQGERVSLAKSYIAPVGTQIAFDVILMNSTLEPLLREWLDYGLMRGLGQWRNAGYGRFTYDIQADD